MPYYCQFCDKEMVFAQSIKYVQEYITCGAQGCADKATEMAAMPDKPFKLEDNKPKEESSNVIFFSTKTPEDDASWKVVKPQHIPEALKEHEVLKELIEGSICSVNPPKRKEKRKKRSKQKEVFYRVKTVENVLVEIDAFTANESTGVLK